MTVDMAPFTPNPPPGWKRLPLRRIGTTASGSGFPPDLQGRAGQEIAFYKVKHLAFADQDGVLQRTEDTVDRATAAALGATVFPAGAFVYAKVGAALMLGRVRTLPSPACIDNNMAALVPSELIDRRFLFWAMTQVRFDYLVNPGAVPSLSDKNLLAYPVLVPPFSQQQAIADYLDRETAKIDMLIKEQERLIEMLRERRQAVISRSADLVGVRVPSVNLLLDGLKDGTHGSFSRVDTSSGMPLLGARNVAGGQLVLDGAESRISTEDHSAIVSNGFPRHGDVLLVIVGSIGKSAVFDRREPLAFQRSVAFLRPRRDLDSRFLWYQIQGDRFQDELRLRSKVSAQPGVYLGDVAAIPIFRPRIEEQHRVVAYLDEQTAKIDELIAETKRFIELSRERRTALITAAVTGQIGVRDPGVGVA